jgi:hypothetical protein
MYSIYSFPLGVKRLYCSTTAPCATFQLIIQVLGFIQYKNHKVLLITRSSFSWGVTLNKTIKTKEPGTMYGTLYRTEHCMFYKGIWKTVFLLRSVINYDIDVEG